MLKEHGPVREQGPGTNRERQEVPHADIRGLAGQAGGDSALFYVFYSTVRPGIQPHQAC